MSFGVPYIGSKNLIAERLVSQFPRAEYFVDLFAGGCAMTHAAFLSGKFNNFICNDLDFRGVELFKQAVSGKFKNENRWISRDDFYKLKDSDLYVRFCWSFGNNQKDYLYSKQKERQKRALHYAILFDDWVEFYELFPDIYDEVAKEILFVNDVKKRYSIIRHCFASQKMQKLESLQRLERLQRLQSLENLQKLQSLEKMQKLERLQRLQRLQSIETSKLDYRQVAIPYDSVVYADPPYKGKASYSVKFDSDLFFDWCRNQNFPIYISEYDAPKDFKAVFEINKTNCLCAAKNFTNKEKIFLHERWKGGWENA